MSGLISKRAGILKLSSLTSAIFKNIDVFDDIILAIKRASNITIPPSLANLNFKIGTNNLRQFLIDLKTFEKSDPALKAKMLSSVDPKDINLYVEFLEALIEAKTASPTKLNTFLNVAGNDAKIVKINNSIEGIVSNTSVASARAAAKNAPVTSPAGTPHKSQPSAPPKGPPKSPSGGLGGPSKAPGSPGIISKILDVVKDGAQYGRGIASLLWLTATGFGLYYAYQWYTTDNKEEAIGSISNIVACINNIKLDQNSAVFKLKAEIVADLNSLSRGIAAGSQDNELIKKLFGQEGTIANFIQRISDERSSERNAVLITSPSVDTPMSYTSEEFLSDLKCINDGLESLLKIINDEARRKNKVGVEGMVGQPPYVGRQGSDRVVEGNVVLSTRNRYRVIISTRKPSIPQRFILYFANGRGPDGFFSSPEFTAFVDPDERSPLGGVGLIPNSIGLLPIEERIASAIKYCYNNDIDSGKELKSFMVKQINSGVGRVRKLFTNEPEERALRRTIQFYSNYSGNQNDISENDGNNSNSNKENKGLIERMKQRREQRIEDRNNRPLNVSERRRIFSQKNQQSINKDDLTMNKLAESSKPKVDAYENAVKGLEDALTKSYYAGLNSMYNEKPSAPKTDLKDLYGLNKETGAEMIQSAHPKSVYVGEAMGDGALIENSLEQQAKTEKMMLERPTGNFQSKHAFFAHLDKLLKFAKDSGKTEAYKLISETINKLEKN